MMNLQVELVGEMEIQNKNRKVRKFQEEPVEDPVTITGNKKYLIASFH